MAGAAAFCLGEPPRWWAAFARPLMEIFVPAGETEILAVGIQYLRIEGSCYIGIGLLFLLYGLYRGLERAQMSILLTAVSLGVRVALAYALASIPRIGLQGIWWAIPIGWLLADLTGFLWYGLQAGAAALPAGAAGTIGVVLRASPRAGRLALQLCIEI